jgi:hypothetical protein
MPKYDSMGHSGTDFIFKKKYGIMFLRYLASKLWVLKNTPFKNKKMDFLEIS